MPGTGSPRRCGRRISWRAGYSSPPRFRALGSVLEPPALGPALAIHIPVRGHHLRMADAIRERVHIGCKHRTGEPAILVEDFLSLEIHLAALFLVQLGAGLEQKLVK